jgi:RNA polymerase sigma factor for flagellar operon FliA
MQIHQTREETRSRYVMQPSPSFLEDQPELPLALQFELPADNAGEYSASAERAAMTYGEARHESVASAELTCQQVGLVPPGSEAEQVMLAHLPMVRFLARRVHERLPQHVDMEDLVSAGVVGLMDAFQKFDPKKQVQFRSYAQFRIRGAILDSLRALDWGPRELRRKGRQVEDAIQALTSRLGRSPSETEIAREMQLDLDEYQHLLGDLRGLDIGTLNAERSEDSAEDELAFVAGDPDDDPLLQCERSETKARLAKAISELPERERTVLTLYYYEEMTMREVGLTLGVVESRISQVHASAMVRLRAALRVPRSVGKPGSKVKSTFRREQLSAVQC